MRSRAVMLVLFVVLGALGGCQGDAPAVSNPYTIDAREYDRVYEASIDVLRDAQFQIEHRNHRFGEVTSEPKGSPTAVELWKGDNATARQAWQSTLADMRRVAHVSIKPTGAADHAQAAGGPTSATAPATGPGAAEAKEKADGSPTTYQLRVEVIMERYQAPVRRMTGSVRTGVFTSLDSTPPEWERRGITADYWQPIGRDPYMERQLVREIIRQSMKVEMVEGQGAGE